ncbi:uncharacterized protein ACLA_061610 [Aspergillus clavatus NRRL 1]|uniref:Uncharacterized protein n=1 Tax=Aspergillus clavatus (strain ATCC 1007 / CBS 513.65 / DSM 816 / NCTC 3887 / NRRL 1 / QM 1276 / 107) TaxID=344612 RepID=A1CCE2_ASPCL|nr:uncharacterized protein ACLA_061610 [Aspergillus clavatus NRRL 1]EAW12199.1 hypothetical protein ACLA_061610 [Aspergillus clavatus NRRL 1]
MEQNKPIHIERGCYFDLGPDTGSIQNVSFRAFSIFYHGASELPYSNAKLEGRRTQEPSEIVFEI